MLNSAFTCQIAPIPSLPNCFIIKGGVCIECIYGYYLKNGTCTPVSILCANYNK
jgi:hypothetical protein